MKFVCILFLSALALQASTEQAWRSALFPVDWEHGQVDAQGRFLHDFSYAGYHRGERPLPRVEGPVFDVVQKFGADRTGRQDATPKIQAAIDAAEAAKGGVVLIPEGHYLLLGGLKVGKSGVVIRGAGPQKTRLFFSDQTSERMTGVDIAGYTKVDYETPLAVDAAQLSDVILLEDASGLQVGDDIDLGWVITDAFVAEHGMTGTWKAHNGKWYPFFRLNVVAIDRTRSPHQVQVDVPLRYRAQIRDSATIRRRTKYIEECGVEDLSVSNPMLEGTVDGFAQSVRRQLIMLRDAKNCWVRNVHSFAPAREGYDPKYHVYDKGIGVSKSKRITIQDCILQYAQRRDGGGHGYLYEIGGSNDILFKDCQGIGGRHNFTSNWFFGSVGNVFLRCLTRSGSLSDWNHALGPSDFHHSLSMGNLIDSCTIDDGWYGMNRGAMSGGAGHTVTESVFWNCSGTGEVRSAQYGWGYLIGMADTLQVITEVDLTKKSPNWLDKQYVGTEPFDFVEGAGLGDLLEPQSLYEAQLKLRLEGPTVRDLNAKATGSLSDPEAAKLAALSALDVEAASSVAPDVIEMSASRFTLLLLVLFLVVLIIWWITRKR